MATDRPQWRLHVGAHKTATTHLQDTLLSRLVDLDQAGLHFISRDRLLIAGLIRYLRFGEVKRKGLTERLVLKTEDACMRHRLLKRMRTHDRVLISEERILGRATDLLQGFYPELETYLGTLARIIGDDPVALFLSIRSQADVLPSAYSQALRTHNRPRPFDTIVGEWLETPPRWVELIERLKRALPGASLKVWTFEEYVADPARVIAALTGHEDLQIAELTRPERTRRLTAEAVSALEKVQPLDLSEDEKHMATARAAELAGPNFDPLNDQQREIFARVYAEDVAKIPTSCRL